MVDRNYISKACAKLRVDDTDNEFVLSRILFLTTFAEKLDLEVLIDKEGLAETICLNISRHAEQYSLSDPGKFQDQMADMALAETLKLLFNVVNKCPTRIKDFSPALQHVLVILSKLPISPYNPLDNPVASLVNALVNLDFKTTANTATIFPDSLPHIYTDRLIEILDKATKVYKDSELELLVSPLVLVIQKAYEVAPNDVKSKLRKIILPSTTDREQPLGRAETLPSRLLRQSTNPATPQLGNTISSLQFEMSNKDARTFVQNVGYGFASGFLFKHNVPVPENALEAWSNDNEVPQPDVQHVDRAINPITGQFSDREEHIDVNMTEEEREREAERLFVLFERSDSYVNFIHT